ncbi:hypothetical protein ACFV0O_02885 [Kitasatospora sp. NPDC059577]|uniref:hypothetical protein n=1 Tax=Kitasatospora sp. NPDC059577 TaxID=3346873 RepID=UPI0036BE3012
MRNHQEHSRFTHVQGVPVTLRPDLVVLGPTGARAGELHEELVRRADRWQAVRGAAARPRFTDTALVVRDTLREMRARAPDTSAAVVHREDGTVDWLHLAGAPARPSWSGIRTLTDLLTFDQPPPGDALRAAEPLLGRWSGLLTVPGQAFDAHREDPDERLALTLVLDGLRTRAVEPYPGRSPRPDGPVVAAAGPTEGYWLLDGALGLLARWAVDPDPAATEGPVVTEGPGTERVAAVYRVPELPGDWRIARISDRPSETVVAEAWGAHAAEAVRHATALERRHRVGAPSTDELLGALGGEGMRRLAADILGCLAVRRRWVRGIRVEADPLLGGQSLAWGPVWLR